MACEHLSVTFDLFVQLTDLSLTQVDFLMLTRRIEEVDILKGARGFDVGRQFDFSVES